MKEGFVPALGTPLDRQGNLLTESFKKQIEAQIEAGAVGLLCMGSMGIQAFIRSSVYPQVAKAAVEAAAGRVPVFVGAMDTSIARAKERMAALEKLDIAGFVFTAPYYSPASRDQMMNFFKGVAAATRHRVLLYDLPGVTQCKITYVDNVLVVDEQDAMDSEMLEKAEEEAANKAAAASVIEAIDAIGEVTLNSEETIEAARAAYEKLTDAQKDYVANYDTLVTAEAKLAELKATQNKPSGGQTPATGDKENLTLPLIGILMSMIVLSGALAVFRKRKNT